MSESVFNCDRRELLAGTAMTAMLAAIPTAARADAAMLPAKARPLALARVRLLPSHFLDAIEANRRYLMSIEPDRLLHNYRKFAGLKPKGEIYGGWESDTIAGEALGHYLSALSLLHAQTGDAEAARRIHVIIDELAEVQAAHGDGYVAGFMRRRSDGAVVDGKEIFPEIMRSEIRSAGFDLNGSWVPFYNWHKLFAGLFDAQTHTGNPKAVPIAVALAGYIEKVFAALNDDQVQTVLDCEHGGINESLAELFARTGDKRWLALSERLYHRKVLDPLTAGEDILANIHANTQVPKLIGLARLHELTGNPARAAAARFFWERVTQHHSYVIGGNADREYFFGPDRIADHITEQTCESCNTYNMLKLTRHLFAWRPNGALFDYYERAHLNHILGHQNPKTGMFAYMIPLMSGTARSFSTPFDSFWCCVCTGMESHSKHGDSIWWEGEDTLFVNLFIPSRAEWPTKRAAFELTTRYPYEGQIALKVTDIERSGRFAIALRIPGWASGATLKVNGKITSPISEQGYALIRRRWKAGDVVTLDLPLELRLEATPGNEEVVALLRGPMVLAADLGPADRPYEGDAPALVGQDLIAGFAPIALSEATYRTRGIGRPTDMDVGPFYRNYERRSAVYFNRFDDTQWAQAQVAYAAEQARLKDLQSRSVDVMHLGEMQAERDHALTSDRSYPVVYRARNGRDARTEGFFEFTMKVRPGPLMLQATYWGEERKRLFHILVDGKRIASQTLNAEWPGQFFDMEYAIPESLTRGKEQVRVRFEPEPGNTAGPVFGVRIFVPKTTAA
jgi:uncharacterized protein